MIKLATECNPYFKKLLFDTENSEVHVGQTDFVLMDADTLRAFIEGINNSTSRTADYIIFEAGKCAGKSFVKRLEHKGGKPQEALAMLSEFFTYCGWGRTHISEDQQKKEVVVTIENCVIARNTKSEKPVCHLIAEYLAGVYEAVLCEVAECVEVLCISKGDPFCEFKIYKMFS
jgi:bacteriochlorophyll 4-vinyl reductase